MLTWLETLDFFNIYYYFAFEDFVVVIFLYSFFKYLIMCAITELIWPTQFFNRRQNIGYQVWRFRTYTEVLLKLRGYSNYYYAFNTFLIKYIFVLRK